MSQHARGVDGCNAASSTETTTRRRNASAGCSARRSDAALAAAPIFPRRTLFCSADLTSPGDTRGASPASPRRAAAATAESSAAPAGATSVTSVSVVAHGCPSEVFSLRRTAHDHRAGPMPRERASSPGATPRSRHHRHSPSVIHVEKTRLHVAPRCARINAANTPDPRGVGSVAIAASEGDEASDRPVEESARPVSAASVSASSFEIASCASVFVSVFISAGGAGGGSGTPKHWSTCA